MHAGLKWHNMHLRGLILTIFESGTLPPSPISLVSTINIIFHPRRVMNTIEANKLTKLGISL